MAASSEHDVISRSEEIERLTQAIACAAQVQIIARTADAPIVRLAAASSRWGARLELLTPDRKTPPYPGLRVRNLPPYVAALLSEQLHADGVSWFGDALHDAKESTVRRGEVLSAETDSDARCAEVLFHSLWRLAA